MSNKKYFNCDVDSKFVAHSLNESLNFTEKSKYVNGSLDLDSVLISHQSYYNQHNQKRHNQTFNNTQNDSQLNLKFNDSFNQPISFQQIDLFKQQVINTTVQSEKEGKKYRLHFFIFNYTLDKLGLI
jgi:hypothetical protein